MKDDLRTRVAKWLRCFDIHWQGDEDYAWTLTPGPERARLRKRAGSIIAIVKGKKPGR